LTSQFCTAFGPIDAAEMACVLNARSTTHVPSPVGLLRQRVPYCSGWPTSRRARRSASVPLRPGVKSAAPPGATTCSSVEVHFHEPWNQLGYSTSAVSRVK